MVRKNAMPLLAEILSSRVRAEIFRLLFGLSDEALYMREIERRSGFSAGAVQQELKKLVYLDLLKPRRDGNRLYYQANLDHPLYNEVHNLVLKGSGLAGPPKMPGRGSGRRLR
jgi:DNA-binding transcriptional ArsR family regulator